MGASLWHVGNERLNLDEPERYQKMSPSAVIDIGVVVVSLHVEHLPGVYQVELIVCTKAKGPFFLHGYLLLGNTLPAVALCRVYNTEWI